MFSLQGMGEVFLARGCLSLWEANPELEESPRSRDQSITTGWQAALHADHVVVTYHLSFLSPQFSLLRPKAIAEDDLPLGREGGEEEGGIRL